MYFPIANHLSLVLLFVVPNLALSSHEYNWQNKQIVLELNMNFCLSSGTGNLVNMMNCNKNDENQRWSYDKNSRIIHDASGKCLDYAKNGNSRLFECKGEESKWDFIEVGEGKTFLLESKGSDNNDLCLAAPFTYELGMVLMKSCKKSDSSQKFVPHDGTSTETISKFNYEVQDLKGEKKQLIQEISKIQREKSQANQEMNNLHQQLQTMKKEKAQSIQTLEKTINRLKDELEKEKESANEAWAKVQSCSRILKKALDRTQ